MEYFLGPVIALLLGMKFTAYKSSAVEARIQALEERIEQVDKTNEEMPKKILAVVSPVAAAVKKLNQEVGIWWM